MHRALLLVFLFTSAISLAKDKGKLPRTPIHMDPCAERVTNGYFERGSVVETPNYKDPVSLMKGILNANAWGPVRSFFSKEWDTEVFYTATGIPDPKTFEVPLVDPNSKGVVLFIHGSGTSKSSGSNFVGNMATLSNYGYTGVSIDLPFHADGPLSNKLYDADAFIGWLTKIVEDIKASGKPVYIAGHSFGPDVIFELISRNPFLVNGVTALSPVAFNALLRKWYDEFTSQMKFGGDVAPNPMGGSFADDVVQKFLWSTGALADPTKVNPNLVIRILSGNREEYVPAPVGGPNKTPIGENTYDISVPLQKAFSGAVITIEKGTGHYLFDFKDENGFNVVQRELLLTLGEDPAKTKELTDATAILRQARLPSERLAGMVLTDLIFRSWYLSKYSERLAQEILRDKMDNYAERIIEEYFTTGRLELFQIIMAPIFATQETHPEFYQKYAEQIARAREKRVVDSSLVGSYYKLINSGYSITIN
jgi:pimeloyl-ACP methyl ester carboxylesterase